MKPRLGCGRRPFELQLRPLGPEPDFYDWPWRLDAQSPCHTAAVHPLLRATVILVLLVVVAYGFLCALLYFQQRSMIYLSHGQMSHGEVMTLANDGEELRISVRKRPGQGGAVIYFGGNAEDVSQSVPQLAAAFPDRSIYALHYRGYGGSSGEPSESGLVSDGLALFDQVSDDHPQTVVIGRSLGSGVATQVASQRPVERLVLVTPYDSLVSVAASNFRYFPVRWLLRDRFDSCHVAPEIEAPTLLIAAENDEVIPRKNTEALLGCFSAGTASLAVLARVGHNTISSHPDYSELLRRPSATSHSSVESPRPNS
ncbi:MAG: lysophospholipase [Thermoanaerobaculia bacterium]|nr:lysophospholipase [Thermoanaerobaculia bacterium]